MDSEGISTLKNFLKVAIAFVVYAVVALIACLWLGEHPITLTIIYIILSAALIQFIVLTVWGDEPNRHKINI